MKLDHQFTPYTEINSRWIKDLTISHNTIKVLEENISRKISDIPCSNIFTDMSPTARLIKERINKWDFFKKKYFCIRFCAFEEKEVSEKFIETGMVRIK